MKNSIYPNVNAELARYKSSITELAGYMKMTRQNLNGKLNGTVTLNIRDMIKIREFFMVKYSGVFTMDYLFNDEPKHNS